MILFPDIKKLIIALLVLLCFDFLLQSQEIVNIKRQNQIREKLQKVAYYIKTDSVKELAKTYSQLATLYIDNSEYDHAFECCHKIIYLTQKYNLPENGKCFFDMGRIFSDWGIYDSSVFYYNKSLDIAQKQGKKELEADILNNIGYLHRLWGNYDLALEAFKKTLEIDLLFNDSSLIASDLNNIAHAYVYQKDYNNALTYYKKSLAISTKNNLIYEMGLAHSGMGSVYLKQGKYNIAETMVKKAINYFIQSEQSSYLPGVYIKLGDIFGKMKQTDSALFYIDKGYKLARIYNDAEIKTEALKLFSEVYFNKGDYIKANNFKEQYMLLKDSLFNVQRHKQLADFQNKYNLKKFEEELAASKRETQKLLSHGRMWVYISSVIFLSLLLSLTWIGRKHRNTKILLDFIRKQKQEIEIQLSIIKYEKETAKKNNVWNPSEETILETFQEISDFLKKTKLYLSSELTLPTLAQECGIQAHYISRAINTITNSNFNDYINAYRIEEAKQRLQSTQFEHFTIDAIGQSVGFKSRTSFIAAFRKFEGSTPSEYKRKILTKV